MPNILQTLQIFWTHPSVFAWEKQSKKLNFQSFLTKNLLAAFNEKRAQTSRKVLVISAVSRIWIQLPLFYMPYFGRQGQSRNEETRQFTRQVTFRYRGHPVTLLLWSKLFLMKHLTIQHSAAFLEIPLFKVSEWMF